MARRIVDSIRVEQPAKLKLTRRQRERIEQYRRLFTTEDGKAVLADLKKSFLRQPFTPDPYMTAFRAGSFEVVDRMVRFVELDVTAVPEVLDPDEEDEDAE